MAEPHESSSLGGEFVQYCIPEDVSSYIHIGCDTTALSIIDVSLVVLCNSVNEKVDEILIRWERLCTEAANNMPFMLLGFMTGKKSYIHDGRFISFSLFAHFDCWTL